MDGWAIAYIGERLVGTTIDQDLDALMMALS